MPSKIKKALLLGLSILLLVVGSQAEWMLNHEREVLGLSRFSDLKGAPPVLALTTMALGGFRGLISNALWMRATDLQEEGKFFEMVQLADWITKLEPHFTHVWLVQSWNMAYNISVKFKDYKDRWRWVQRGIELLRDDGLRYNPHDVLMHRELAWFFQHKMGADMDDAHIYYKLHWAMNMNEIFGTNNLTGPPGLPKPDWEQLLHPSNTNWQFRVNLLTNKYKLNPVKMKEIDDRYGPLEWRLPEAHAIYWAVLGLEMAALNERKINPEDLITLRRVVYQSMQTAFQRGRLIAANPERKAFEFGPNLEIIPKVNSAYDQAKVDDPKNRDHIETAQRNFLRDVVFYLYMYNQINDAGRWFKHLGEAYPEKQLLDGRPTTLPGHLELYDYVIGRLEEEVGSTGRNTAEMILEGLEATAMRSLAVGEMDRYLGYDGMAERFWERYMAKIPEGDAAERIRLESLPEIRRIVLNRLVASKTLSAEATGQLLQAFRIAPPKAETTNSPAGDLNPAFKTGTGTNAPAESPPAK